MKKLLAVLLMLAILLTACSSGEKQTKERADDANNVYIRMAEDFIAEDNIDSAISVLEKGYAETQSEDIYEMLKDLMGKQAETITEPTTEEPTEATTDPATTDPATEEPTTEEPTTEEATEMEEILWEELSGIYHSDSLTSDVRICFAYDEYADAYRATYNAIPLKDVETYKQSLYGMTDFNEDICLSYDKATGILNYYRYSYTWENDETFNLTMVSPLSRDEALAEIDRCYNTEEQYVETPAYDTSKASGILAERGMTEEEFKSSSIHLGELIMLFLYSDHTASEGRNYYAMYPDDSTPQYYTEVWNQYVEEGVTSPDEDITSALLASSSLDEFLDSVLYKKYGAMHMADKTEAFIEGMIEYPDRFVGLNFGLIGFYPNNYGNYVYRGKAPYSGEDVYYKIYDYRDNPNSPAVIDKCYNMYVTFLGTEVTYFGTNLKFALIALEKNN